MGGTTSYTAAKLGYWGIYIEYKLQIQNAPYENLSEFLEKSLNLWIVIQDYIPLIFFC